MDELVKKRVFLPDTIDELSTFVLIGEQKIKAHEAKIKAISKAGMAEDVRKAAVADGQDMAVIINYAQTRLGELLEAIEPKRDKESSSKRTSLPSLPKGITKKTSHKAQTMSKNREKVDAIIQKAIEKEKIPTPEYIYKEVKNLERKEQKEAEKKELAQKADEFEDKDIKIFNIDFRNLDVDDESIDLILTDPPYPKEHLPLWQDLFKFAYKKLKPSSFLVAYTGQMYLDQIFRMENDLIYYWLMNIEFTKKPLIHGRNVINEWKPIFVFQKPPFQKPDVFSDKIYLEYSEDREMHDKNWGQTVGPFEFLLDRFSGPGDLVLDPFAGTGTTLIACRNKVRKCIGTEIKEDYIDLIKGRLVNGVDC